MSTLQSTLQGSLQGPKQQPPPHKPQLTATASTCSQLLSHARPKRSARHLSKRLHPCGAHVIATAHPRLHISIITAWRCLMPLRPSALVPPDWQHGVLVFLAPCQCGCCSRQQVNWRFLLLLKFGITSGGTPQISWGVAWGGGTHAVGSITAGGVPGVGSVRLKTRCLPGERGAPPAGTPPSSPLGIPASHWLTQWSATLGHRFCNCCKRHCVSMPEHRDRTLPRKCPRCHAACTRPDDGAMGDYHGTCDKT